MTSHKLLMPRYLNRWLSNPERKPLFKWSAGFFFFVSLLCIMLGLQYLFTYTLPSELLGILYTFFSFISHFIFIGFLPWLVLVLPLIAIIPSKRVVIPFSIFIATIILTALVLDGVIFSEHRFHFSTVLVMILGWKTWGFGIALAMIYSAILFFLSKWVWQQFVIRAKRLPGWWIGGITIVLLLTTHVMHIWAEATYYSPITRFTTYLPVFYPTTARRFLIKHGFISDHQVHERRIISKIKRQRASALQYPLKELSYQPPQQRLNIVMIILDAVRSDMLSNTTMPKIKALGDSNITFVNHYSGGNSSRMGCFSFFYGLPSNYQHVFEDHHCSPVLMDAAIQQHYDIRAFHSASFAVPVNLEATVFSRIPSTKLVALSGKIPVYARDSAITETWFNWLNSRDSSTPFFGVLYYTSAHSRSSPPNAVSPCEAPPNASTIQKRFSQYCASTYFMDSLVSLVIGDLERSNLLSSTAVIITGDHGEEFDENGMGFKGHGTAFSEYQLHIPLVVLWPGKSPAQVTRRTSHYDISATLMSDVFGCTNQPSDYCSGKNIFEDTQWDWLVVGSYYNFAVLEPQLVTIQYPNGYFEARDRDYKIIKKTKLNAGIFSAAFNETSRFFKK